MIGEVFPSHDTTRCWLGICPPGQLGLKKVRVLDHYELLKSFSHDSSQQKIVSNKCNSVPTDSPTSEGVGPISRFIDGVDDVATCQEKDVPRHSAKTSFYFISLGVVHSTT
jgi:hypothetical protein